MHNQRLQMASASSLDHSETVITCFEGKLGQQIQLYLSLTDEVELICASSYIERLRRVQRSFQMMHADVVHGEARCHPCATHAAERAIAEWEDAVVLLQNGETFYCEPRGRSRAARAACVLSRALSIRCRAFARLLRVALRLRIARPPLARATQQSKIVPQPLTPHRTVRDCRATQASRHWRPTSTLTTCATALRWARG